MILYFADRKMHILGQGSTALPDGLTIIEDKKTEDVETGVASFECSVPYTAKTRENVESCTNVGNYILRSHNGENEFYTIIESEANTKSQEVYVYAEDAGLDLLNEVVGKYEADKAYPISFYIEKFAYDSGFKIKINEAASLTRKLSWDGEATVTERLASVATQFDNCEISYSFEVEGLEVSAKYINIYKKRGKDTGEQLRLNKEVNSIIVKKSINSLAPGLDVVGGVPENSENPITLNGYKYDDGDIYISGTRLYSRSALKEWSRYIWPKEPEQLPKESGHIIRQYSYDTTSQAELCAHAVTELKKLKEIEFNYEADITEMPENIQVGDRVNIIDDAGELYLNTRLLKLETSVCEQYQTATLGEHIMKGSGIDDRVASMAKELAENSLSAKRAQAIANAANEKAMEAQQTAGGALESSESALNAAENATTAAENATQAASQAQAAANAAQSAVDTVEESVAGIETTVENAHAAAEQAKQAAETAETKATEAATAASNAETKAEEAKTAAGTAQSTAESAVSKADTAKGTAETAKQQADTAKNTADAAKLDAEQAKKDVDNLADDLTTLSSTMSADYARKTDLTETEASLQTQITQNAGQISSTAQKVTEIDETANNAAETAAAAQTTAQQAQTEANAATAKATEAQTAATNAANAATAAQSEADAAKTAAATAKSVADKAQEDLAAAEADLATVQGRVDATEEDIAAAQTAVNNAQAAAEKAKTDATNAAQAAANAQSKADTAATDAAAAQSTANNAVAAASQAQAAANAAKGDAAAAQATADEAKANAAAAKSTADTAAANAASAQTKAIEAATAATTAKKAADDAGAKVVQAQQDLDEAQKNLADVTGRVDATEEEVEAAKTAVATAQAAAETAKQNAITAQATADKAKQDAETAQTAADNAKSAADAAQADATAAQEAADAAQEAVDALAVRVTTAETQITQNAELIKLAATKTEVEQTLGGYYTKTETDSAISVASDGIKSTVSSEITQKINDIEVGGRNLLLDSKRVFGEGATREFTALDYNLTPIIQEYGEDIYYSLSFDLRSLDTSVKNQISVYPYPQNPEINTYRFPYSTFTVTEEFQRFSIIFKPTAGDLTKPTTRISMYGTYDSGNFPIMKNVKLEVGNKATAWTPAPEDMATAENLETATSDLSDALGDQIQKAASEIEQLADSISMLVVDENGESLMKQTSTGWVFSMKNTIEDLKENAKKLGELEKGAELQEADISLIKNTIARFETLYTYINVGEEKNPATGVMEPCLELGNKTASILKMTNTGIKMVDGDVTPVEVTQKMLKIGTADVGQQLSCGGLVLKERPNGNVGFSWEE